MDINWQNHDDKFFQRFCNALLSLEVSKRFVPFSAPGKDGGIDGLFSGDYDGHSGEWRFQDKFHKTARKEAYRSLRSDIVPEIQKLENEDHFIILSNVSLLPQEKKELHTIADQELLRLNKGNVRFDVWDDAKIHTLYIRHPLMRLWLEEGFTTAQLISYQDYFGKRLTVDVDDPSTLANEFIARELDLKLLHDFRASDTENIAVVSGEAGIGKTRLVIEFFKRCIDILDEWQALVLNSHRINFDKIAFVLSGNSNILVLVDDAHTYAPEVIADLRNLIRLPGQRRIKFILTGRRLLIDRALEMIPAVEDKTIKSIPLLKLSSDETREIFKRQQNIGRYKDFIPQLVSTSNGRPILIVALLRAIHRNTPIPQIKDQDVLKDYVREYFNTVVRVVSDHIGANASRLRLERLVRVISLLEPLPANDDAFYQQLAQFAETTLTDLRYFMNELLKEGLALKRHEFVLSPDYYSDIMLATADEELVLSAIATFPRFISNIIVNLSAVDEAYDEEKQGRLGLAPILLIYIPQIEDAHPSGVQDILTTISSIAYQKPDFAKLAITIFVARVIKPESQDLRDLMTFDIDTRSGNRKSLYGAIALLLHDLLYRPGNEKFVFDAVATIYKCAPDLGLFKSTFGLDKRHIMHGYNFQQQYIFIAESLKLLQVDHRYETLFIDAFKDFLSLEVTVSSLDPFKNGQINITTFYLSSDDVVIAFRRKVIDALITIFHAALNEDIKKRVVHELMDVPRGISASSRSQNPYKGVDEIVYILEFIESIAGSMPLSANREVIDRLYWIKKWGADDRIISKIAALNKALEPKSLPEKIIFILSNAETRIEHDYQKLVAKVIEQAKILVAEYDAETIAESLAQVRRVQTNHQEFIWAFNQALYLEFSAKAMIVYDRLWIIDREYIWQYGSTFLAALRFKHGKNEFYWAKVGELESDGGVECLNVILQVYHRSTEGVEQKDIQLIERVFSQHKDKWQISFGLFMALATINNSGHDVSDLITGLFDISPQRPVDNFLMFNREMDGNFLKQLVLQHTVRFHLSFEIQHTLALLFEKQMVSEDELFEYLFLRFQLKSVRVAERDFGSYEFVPHDNFNLFASFDDNGKRRIFMRGVLWYVNSDFKGMTDYYAKDLLEFLQPGKQLTPELVSDFESAVDGLNGVKQLQRVIASIDVFESKTKELIDLVVKILKKGSEMSADDLKELRSAAYMAITSVGVKAGAVGEPFAVDVALKQLITDWMADHPNDDVAAEFLSKVVQSLDEQIKRSTDRDEATW